ncbi:MAG: major capsid protein V20 domain-containing protein, partial [Candidatus Fonsibacter sp.]
SVISCARATEDSGIRPHPEGPSQGVGANLDSKTSTDPNPGVQNVPTTGSVLILNFAEVIQLTEELYAPCSLGCFNLQLQATVQNNQNKPWLGSEYELVIMVMNSGVFVNERGTSSTFIGPLTKQDVLDALQQQQYH